MMVAVDDGDGGDRPQVIQELGEPGAFRRRALDVVLLVTGTGLGVFWERLVDAWWPS